jgi:hypothetical protein
MIYVLGDIHLGTRKNNKRFHENLMRELKSILSKLRSSDELVILGDVFDHRNVVDFMVLNDAFNEFFSKVSKICNTYILVGNHDLYYKEMISENINIRFLQNLPNIYVMQDICVKSICGYNCLFIPWIDTEEAKIKAIAKIQETEKDVDVIFGHFDINALNHAEQNPLALSPVDLKNSKLVLSGHYHKRGKVENIQYVGSLIGHSFNDLHNKKAYAIIGSNLEVKYIPTHAPEFDRITIANTKEFLAAWGSLTAEDIEKMRKRIQNNIIEIVLREHNMDNETIFNIFRGMNPFNLSVSFEKIHFTAPQDNFEGFNSSSDIKDLIIKYIGDIKDSISSDIKHEDIQKLIQMKNEKFKTII